MSSESPLRGPRTGSARRRHPARRPRARLLADYGAASAVVLFGFLVSFAMFAVVRSTESRARDAEFDSLTRDRVTAIQNTVDAQLAEIDGLHALFHSTEMVTRNEFMRFSRVLLADNDCLQALEWIPLVPAERRSEFESMARADGLEEFEFLEVETDGSLRTAHDRPEYFPVFFVEPLEGNERALGFDLASDPARRNAIELSRTTALPSATGRVRLVQEAGTQNGLLVFLPVVSDVGRMDGLVLGVLRVGRLLRRTLAELQVRPIEISLYDVTDPGPPVFLARVRGQDVVEGPDLAPPADALPGGVVQVANRNWAVFARVIEPNWASRAMLTPLGLLAIGLGATMALAGFLVHRVHAEHRVRRFERELAHLSRVATTGELAASIAHELNQPLCAIVLHAQAAKRQAGVDRRSLEDSLDRIVSDGERAGETIKNLRGFLRKGEVARHQVDLAPIVRETVAMFKATDRFGYAVELKMAPDLPAVMVNKVQMQQVILNLMRNGVDATEQTDSEARLLRVSVATSEERWVVTSVEDMGPGLSGVDEDEMFSPFFTTKESGMGMGLSISRSIIESHGGRIWAIPSELGGAWFRFSLPFSNES